MLKAISPRLRKPLLYAIIGAAFVAMSVAVAAGKTWWPYAAILAVAGLGYLFGLSHYGIGEQDPAEEDAGAGHGTPSALSW